MRDKSVIQDVGVRVNEPDIFFGHQPAGLLAHLTLTLSPTFPCSILVAAPVANPVRLRGGDCFQGTSKLAYHPKGEDAKGMRGWDGH